MRGPQKLFFLVHLAVALLAGFGLERCLREAPRGRRRLWLVLPGLAWLGIVLALRVDAGAVRSALGTVVPPLADPRGLVAARSLWPHAWLPSAALALAAGLALARGGAWARTAAVVVALDLCIVNGGINSLSPASFYDLRPEVAALVRGPAAEGVFRWFSYGVAHTPGLRFTPLLARAPSDVWLYYLDRQSLLPQTQVLDGLEGGADIDRTGLSPTGATLPPEAAVPGRFAGHHRLLQLANVRWLLSFSPLPDALVARRGEARLPEIEPPLGLYEMREPLPRAFFKSSLSEASLAFPESGAVAYQRIDPHTVALRANTPPGFIVVLDGHHPDWKAEDQSGPVPLQVAFGRYQAIPTRGGEAVVTLRYQPAWRAFALGLFGTGGLAVLWLALRR